MAVFRMPRYMARPDDDEETPAAEARSAAPRFGDNGGPPLDEEPSPWLEENAFGYLCWREAHRRAWRVPRDIALYRLERAERIGLTYEEYTLEILERGRNLQPTDIERIEAIKRARPMAWR
jgi:hypothetical protein